MQLSLAAWSRELRTPHPCAHSIARSRGTQGVGATGYRTMNLIEINMIALLARQGTEAYKFPQNAMMAS